MHDYDDFDPAHAIPAVEAAPRLAAGLAPCIAAFRAEIDPSAPPREMPGAPESP